MPSNPHQTDHPAAQQPYSDGNGYRCCHNLEFIKIAVVKGETIGPGASLLCVDIHAAVGITAVIPWCCPVNKERYVEIVDQGASSSSRELESPKPPITADPSF